MKWDARQLKISPLLHASTEEWSKDWAEKAFMQRIKNVEWIIWLDVATSYTRGGWQKSEAHAMIKNVKVRKYKTEHLMLKIKS